MISLIYIGIELNLNMPRGERLKQDAAKKLQNAGEVHVKHRHFFKSALRDVERSPRLYGSRLSPALRGLRHPWLLQKIIVNTLKHLSLQYNILKPILTVNSMNLPELFFVRTPSKPPTNFFPLAAIAAEFCVSAAAAEKNLTKPN